MPGSKKNDAKDAAKKAAELRVAAEQRAAAAKKEAARWAAAAKKDAAKKDRGQCLAEVIESVEAPRMSAPPRHTLAEVPTHNRYGVLEPPEPQSAATAEPPELQSAAAAEPPELQSAAAAAEPQQPEPQPQQPKKEKWGEMSDDEDSDKAKTEPMPMPDHTIGDIDDELDQISAMFDTLKKRQAKLMVRKEFQKAKKKYMEQMAAIEKGDLPAAAPAAATAAAAAPAAAPAAAAAKSWASAAAAVADKPVKEKQTPAPKNQYSEMSTKLAKALRIDPGEIEASFDESMGVPVYWTKVDPSMVTFGPTTKNSNGKMIRPMFVGNLMTGGPGDFTGLEGLNWYEHRVTKIFSGNFSWIVVLMPKFGRLPRFSDS